MIWKILEALERSALVLFAVVILAVMNSCPTVRYPNRYFANVTSYKIDVSKGSRTVGGVLVVGTTKDVTTAMKDHVDQIVNKLDKCLQVVGKKPIERGWFGVFVPPDWYTSPCTGQQLVPSRADYRLCEQKTDPQGNPIKISVECRGVVTPNTT
jgi:hypothetical protein